MSESLHEAVMFFEQGRLTKEMLHAEFEAILDGVVGLPEYAGTTQRAAFVTLDEQLRLTSCVLFLVGFDRAGKADRRWNIPLRHIADQAGAGPDIGTGAIRFASRSRCPVSWHSESLWDADRVFGAHPLLQIVEAIRCNRLGLALPRKPVAVESKAVPVAGQEVAGLTAQFRQLLQDRDLEKQRLQAELEAIKTHNARLLAQHEQLRQRLVVTARDHQDECQSMRDQVAEMREQWRSQSEQWLNQRVMEETARLREAIDIRDLELRQRYESAKEMRDEIHRLRQEQERMKNACQSEGDDDFLYRQLKH